MISKVPDLLHKLLLSLLLLCVYCKNPICNAVILNPLQFKEFLT